MADKEERILHIVQKLDGRFVGENRISAQEAIERMAKALEEKSEQMARECLNSDPYNNPWGAEDLAEAALNSLLDEKWLLNGTAKIEVVGLKAK